MDLFHRDLSGSIVTPFIASNFAFFMSFIIFESSSLMYISMRCGFIYTSTRNLVLARSSQYHSSWTTLSSSPCRICRWHPLFGLCVFSLQSTVIVDQKTYYHFDACYASICWWSFRFVICWYQRNGQPQRLALTHLVWLLSQIPSSPYGQC